MQPNLQWPFDKRSFYTNQEQRDIGNGIVLWRGLFQSVRPASGRMLIDIDISTGYMYKECLTTRQRRIQPQQLAPRVLRVRTLQIRICSEKTQQRCVTLTLILFYRWTTEVSSTARMSSPSLFTNFPPGKSQLQVPFSFYSKRHQVPFSFLGRNRTSSSVFG